MEVKKMKEVDIDYEFSVGDVVVWANDGVLAIADSEQECIDEGITKDGMVSYFIYGIDKDTTERFDYEMERGRAYMLEKAKGFDSDEFWSFDLLKNKDAARILGLSSSRVSQLVKDGYLTVSDGYITLESVVAYKKKKVKVGRPIGSYKKNK
jgi:hypothetical protein